MANLIIQDTFEPYYAGRDDKTKTRAKARPSAKGEPARPPEDEIVLPEDALTTVGEVRRDAGRTRRIVSH
jgi:hypothetical protein